MKLPDQARHFVWPDLDPICLQRSLAAYAGRNDNTFSLSTIILVGPSISFLTAWVRSSLLHIQRNHCNSNHIALKSGRN